MKTFYENFLTFLGIFSSGFFNKLNYLPEQEIEKYQKKLIKKQINYCIKNIEFYKNLEIKVKDNPLDTLKQFPIISKDDVIKNPEKFRPARISNFLSSSHSTSGITGKILKSDCSPFAWIIEQAAIWSHWRSANYKFRDRILILRGYNPQPDEPIFKKNRIKNWLYFSPRHLNEDDLHEKIKIIEDFSPLFIRGYPSTIKQLAFFCFKNNISFPSLKGILSASETFIEKDREFVKKAFNAPIYDHYGQAEISCMFHECDAHKGMHLIPYYGYVEFLPDKSGNLRIIATNLRNKFLPLIRYDTGDLVESFTKEKCECLKTTLRVPSIVGRADSMLYDLNNNKFSSTSMITFLSSFPFLKRFQIVQKKDLKTEFIYEYEKGLDNIELETYLKNIFGREIVFNPSNNFILSSEGKFSSIITSK